MSIYRIVPFWLPHSHCSSLYPDTRLLYRKALGPILPVLICVISDDLDRLTLLWRICILRDGVGWILLSADPRFSSDQSLVHSFRAWDLIAVRTVDIILF